MDRRIHLVVVLAVAGIAGFTAATQVAGGQPPCNHSWQRGCDTTKTTTTATTTTAAVTTTIPAVTTTTPAVTTTTPATTTAPATTTTAPVTTTAPATTTTAPVTTTTAPVTTPSLPGASGWWAAGSPFNTPIPANATVDPNSGAWVNMLNNSSAVNSIWVNSTAWTTTAYHAKASTPTVVVSVANTGKHIRIPYQSGWAASPDSDAHIAIIDDSTGCEYEFEMFNPSNLSSHAVAVFHLYTGSGAHVADAGATGGEMSVLAGLITPQDVASGSINHALRMGTPVNSSSYRLPATRSDGNTSGGIPEGALIRLDPTLSLSSYNLNAFQTMYAKALQKYGAYVDDNTGSLTVYAESTTDGSSYNPAVSGLPKSLVAHLQVMSEPYSSVQLDSNTMPNCNAPY